MRYALKQLGELTTTDLSAVMMPSAGARIIRRQGRGFTRDNIAKLMQYRKSVGQTRPNADPLELIAKRIESGKLVLIRIPAPLVSSVVSPSGNVNHLLPTVLGNKVHELAELTLVEDIESHIRNENSVNQSGGYTSAPAVVAATTACAVPAASRTIADAVAAPIKEVIQLTYNYDNGQPIEDIPYVVNHAGNVYDGVLTGGTGLISDLDPGSYTVEYKAVDENEIVALRKELKTNLEGMISEVKAKAKIQEDLIAKESYVMQGLIYSGAFFTGLYESGSSIASGLVEAVESGAEFVFDTGTACWRLLKLLAAGDLAGLRSEFEEIAKLGGETFDAIKDCFKTLYVIAMDAESRSMLSGFPESYFDAHSSVEKKRLVGKLAFEIIFAIATFGAGAAVSAIAKSKYFVKAAQAVQDITKHIKLEKLNHKRDGTTNDDVLDEAERIDDELLPPIKSFKRRPQPKSLSEATARLDLARTSIIKNGYIAKYNDDELLEMAKSGSVAKERFQIRMMAKNDLEYNTLGAPLVAESGTGAKYWLTSFDQLEDADTDPKLISQKLGLDYNPDNPLAMVIIDSEKAKNVVDTHTIVPTFEKLGEFAIKELSKKLSPEQVKTIMTPEFQATYADNIQQALDSKIMTSEWHTKGALDYINGTIQDDNLKKLLSVRIKMQEQLGNNQHFTGNGLTKNLLPNTSAHGVVETFNFERKLVNLDDYGDAIHINHDLSLIK